MLQIGLAWLIVSVLAMVGLTVFVFIGGRRTRALRSDRFVTFDEAQVYSFSADRRRSERDDDLDEHHEATAAHTAAWREAEPAINHPVSADSGALDRLLAGVQMPCNLERLYPEGEDERIRMAFVTSDHEPKVVAVSVADELERLGMDIEPLSFTEARAWRDGFELAVTIHMDPRAVIRGRRPAFPTAPEDSIVIEFSVV
ncbi:MAG: hypothetical protein OEY23_13405 [Acidimicrobiia bacterium]|nr:hypothetical protein [Acidimicrobiia bacterium]